MPPSPPPLLPFGDFSTPPPAPSGDGVWSAASLADVAAGDVVRAEEVSRGFIPSLAASFVLIAMRYAHAFPLLVIAAFLESYADSLALSLREGRCAMPVLGFLATPARPHVPLNPLYALTFTLYASDDARKPLPRALVEGRDYRLAVEGDRVVLRGVSSRVLAQVLVQLRAAQLAPRSAVQCVGANWGFPRIVCSRRDAIFDAPTGARVPYSRASLPPCVRVCVDGLLASSPPRLPKHTGRYLLPTYLARLEGAPHEEVSKAIASAARQQESNMHVVDYARLVQKSQRGGAHAMSCTKIIASGGCPIACARSVADIEDLARTPLSTPARRSVADALFLDRGNAGSVRGLCALMAGAPAGTPIFSPEAHLRIHEGAPDAAP